MGNNSVNAIRKLIAAFEQEELRNAKIYLGQFHKMYGNYIPKTLRLLNLIELNPKLSDSTIQQRLDADCSPNTFRMLCMRLRYKLLESLVLELNIRRSDQYSLSFAAKAQVRKIITQAEIVHSRGLLKEAIQLYQQAMRFAAKYELYDNHIEALRALQYIEMLSTGKRNIQKEGEMEFLQMKENHLHQCKKMFYSTARNDFFTTSQKKRLPSEMAEQQRLLNLNKTLDSKTGFYYLHLNCINALESNQKYEDALFRSTELLRFIKQHRAVAMNRRIGSAYIHIGFNSLQLCNFDFATRSLRNALKQLEPNSFNARMCHRLMIIAHLQNGAFKQARKALQLSLKKKSLLTEFELALTQFIKAAVFMQLQEHQQAHHALQLTQILDNDKFGWNIGVRILNLMNQIAWGRNDSQLEALLTNLLVHMRHMNKKAPHYIRLKHIVFVFQQLSKNAFRFQEAAYDCEDSLQKLQSDDEHFTYIPIGPEIVRFDLWFFEQLQEEKCQVLV